MDDLAATDIISNQIGESRTEGHNVRHERGTKKLRMEDYSGIQRDSG